MSALAAMIHNSPRQAAQRRLMEVVNGGSPAPVQAKSAGAGQDAAPQLAAKPNNTGLPDNLKSGIENLSGMSMDHVNVHYNSSQPAQLNALAYAQGSDIHVAPGQEQHLPHEAWHVVQQAQGRVQPTVQMKGEVAQTPSIKASGSPVQRKWVNNGGQFLIWDRFIDGARWFYDTESSKMFYTLIGFTSERKDREEWVKEHGSDPLAKLDGSMISSEELAPVDHDLGPAGDLMAQLEERYITKPTWEEGSGPEPSQKKMVLIESFVKLDNGSVESVYKNEMDVNQNKFYAAWNQRTRDTEVGPKKTKAMFNSDLLTCHREIAMDFAKTEGAEVSEDKDVFTVVRKNVNNGDWQAIQGKLPIKIRGTFAGGLTVSESEPVAIGKDFTHTGVDGKTNTVTTMLDVFKVMVPNSKAVYAMIAQRYPEYFIARWEFKGGCLTATVVKK
jgi:hypothetical protein